MERLKILISRQTYYFSVEGETEKWYLDWLVIIINNTKYSSHKISIKSEVQKDPVIEECTKAGIGIDITDKREKSISKIIRNTLDYQNYIRDFISAL